MAKSKNYYTVAEFSEEAGVSPQTIYAQIKHGRLRNYGRKVNGVQKIHVDAMTLYRPEGESEPEEEVEEPAAPESETVALLREQIRILSETLEHEREAAKHTREALDKSQEALKQAHELTQKTQELMRQELEVIKAQMVHFALMAPKDEEPDAQPVADPVPDPGLTGSDPGEPGPHVGTVAAQHEEQKQQQPMQESPKPERKGLFSRLFGK